MTDYQKTKILALRQGGANASQIAMKVGVPRTTVQSFLSHAHIELDKENHRCKRCGKRSRSFPVTVPGSSAAIIAEFNIGENIVVSLRCGDENGSGGKDSTI